MKKVLLVVKNGKNLLGKRKKDIIEVQAPAGIIKYKIIGLSK